MIMKVPRPEAIEIVQNDHRDYEEVSTKIVDQRRWVTVHEQIFHRISDNTHWAVYVERGSTEDQDMGLFEYEREVEFYEMEQVEVTKLEWREKKDAA